MTIGIDIRTLMDEQYSGVSEYTFNLLNAIFKIDNKNEYKLFYNSWHNISDRMPKFNYDNVKIVKTKYPNKLFNNILQKIFKTPKIDELLGVDIFFMPNIGFISLSSRCKKIITIHDLSFLRYPYFFSLKRNLWHKIINVKKIIKNFDHIVAMSENTKKDIIELCKISEEKISVIYSGVSEKYYKIDDKKNIKIKNFPNLPKKFILFLGTLEPRKNVDGIIKAYNKLRKNNNFDEYELVIAGGKGWKNKNIYNAFKNSKYKNDIQFLGYVDNKDKNYLYNLADLFVYPSFYEGFGLPPIEAMACGCPVIASSVSSLPEIVGSAGIMVNPHDISEISQAMNDILSDKNLQNKLSQKGIKKAKEFNWEKSAKKYLSCLKGLSPNTKLP